MRALQNLSKSLLWTTPSGSNTCRRHFLQISLGVVDNSGRRLSSRRRRSCRRLRPWRRHVSLDNNPFNRRICVAVAASLLFIRCRNRNELGRYIVVVTRIYRTANAVIRVRRLRSSLRRSASSSANASSLPTPRSVALRVLPLPARSPSLLLPTLLRVRRDSPPPRCC